MTVFGNVELGFCITPVTKCKQFNKASLKGLGIFLQTANAFLIIIGKKTSLDHQTLGRAADVGCAIKIIEFEILGYLDNREIKMEIAAGTDWLIN